jgi:hypothetical protein
MRIKGKLIYSNMDTNNYVEIELPPVKIEEIKEGDRIWVEVIWEGDKVTEAYSIKIIAHFPKPEQEWCECGTEKELETKVGTHAFDMMEPEFILKCDICHKILKPKEKIELLPEFDNPNHINQDDLRTRRKLNEVIDKLNHQI